MCACYLTSDQLQHQICSETCAAYSWKYKLRIGCVCRVTWTLLSCIDCHGLGRFQCSKCPSKAVAIIEYFLVLLGVLLLNLYLISQLSRATMSDFNTVSGSDYLQVSP